MTIPPFRWAFILAVTVSSVAVPTQQRELRASEQPQLQTKCEGVSVDVHLKVPCRKAVGCDPMNGVGQGLSIAQSGDSTLLKVVLVRDWRRSSASPANDMDRSLWSMRSGNDNPTELAAE